MGNVSCCQRAGATPEQGAVRSAAMVGEEVMFSPRKWQAANLMYGSCPTPLANKHILSDVM